MLLVLAFDSESDESKSLLRDSFPNAKKRRVEIAVFIYSTLSTATPNVYILHQFFEGKEEFYV